MAEVYLVRHGESSMTEQNLYCGFADPPLSERGLQSALRPRELLRGIQFDQVLCSPQLRCRMTLDTVGVEYTVDPGLIEINFGELEGQPLFDDVGRLAIEDWSTCVFPGGDSLPEYFKRAGEKLRSLLEADCSRILAGTHAGFIGSAIGAVFLGGPETLFHTSVRPCAVFHVWKEDGKYRYEELE